MGAKNPIKMKLLSFFSVVPLIAGQETIGLTIAQPPSEVVAQPDLPVTADLPVPDLPATDPATEENEVAEDDSSEIISETADEILMTSVGTSTTFAPPVPEEILPTSLEVSTMAETGGTIQKMKCIQTCMAGETTVPPCPEVTSHSCPEPEPCPTVGCPPPPTTTTSTTTSTTTTTTTEALASPTNFKVKVTTTNAFYAGTDEKFILPFTERLDSPE